MSRKPLYSLSFTNVALQFFAVLLLFLHYSEEGFWVGVLLALSAVDVMRLSVKNMLLGRRTYLAMMTYLFVAVSVVMPSWREALASWMLVRSALFLSYAFRRELSFDYTFRSGIFLSLSSIFAFESVFLLPSLLVGLWYARRTWREILVAFLGYCLPVFVLCYVNWGVNGVDFLEFFTSGFSGVGWASCQCANIYAHGNLSLVNLGLFGLSLLLSVFYIFKNLDQVRRRALRLTMFLVWQCVSCLVIFAFSSSSAVYSLMAVSLSVLMCRVFVLARSRVAVPLYVAMVLAVVAGKIYLETGL